MFVWNSQSPYSIKDSSNFESASLLSKLFFLWINPVINLGYHKPLEASDIPSIPKEFTAEVAVQKFNVAWQNEVNQHQDKARVDRAMFHAFKDNILLSILFFIPYIGTMLMQPFLVNDILSFLEGDSHTFFHIRNGPLLAGVFGVVSFINLMTYSISFTCISQSCICMKAASVAAVFSKSVRLSVTARSQHTTGQKLSLIGMCMCLV
ncbi:hypothetical protein EON65_04125 [archaeon]|nr:MAG: hypothetical protein EON65_04125 [archaeon]